MPSPTSSTENLSLARNRYAPSRSAGSVIDDMTVPEGERANDAAMLTSRFVRRESPRSTRPKTSVAQDSHSSVGAIPPRTSLHPPKFPSKTKDVISPQVLIGGPTGVVEL